jgi:hypothetical protein
MLVWYNQHGARTLSDSGTDAQSLTLKWSPLLGHFCHVKGKDVNIPGVLAVSASRTTRSFLHPVSCYLTTIPFDYGGD